MKHSVVLAVCALVVAPAAWAADARHPYLHIDHRVDAGNDTGDAQVEALNEAQLNGTARPAAGTGQLVPGVATIYPRAAYGAPPYPPPPYYPPPGYWPPPYGY